MTYGKNSDISKYLIKEKELENIFREFIPYYNTKDITHLIYDYYIMSKERKELYEKLQLIRGP